MKFLLGFISSFEYIFDILHHGSLFPLLTYGIDGLLWPIPHRGFHNTSIKYLHRATEILTTQHLDWAAAVRFSIWHLPLKHFWLPVMGVIGFWWVGCVAGDGGGRHTSLMIAEYRKILSRNCLFEHFSLNSVIFCFCLFFWFFWRFYFFDSFLLYGKLCWLIPHLDSKAEKLIHDWMLCLWSKHTSTLSALALRSLHMILIVVFVVYALSEIIAPFLHLHYYRERGFN